MLVVAQNDAVVVSQARIGDPEAWDTLFRRYQLPLYTYAFELVHDQQASFDIVQESFIRAARHIGQLREDTRFGSWLFGIAHQQCLQHWRKHPPERASAAEEALEELADPRESPAEWLIGKEQEDRFMVLLEQLPPTFRSVLLLHFLEEFSLEEIAGITGVSIGTVKSRMHYAKKALRKLLEAS